MNLSDALRLFAPVLLVGADRRRSSVWGRVRTRSGSGAVVDPIKLQLPVFGPLFQKVAHQPVQPQPRHHAELGRPDPAEPGDRRATRPATSSCGDAAVAVQESVRRGESLAGPLAQHTVFPPMVVQMLAVGEDTGAIDTMLQKVSDFYDAEVEATTEALTSLIEPLMIAVLGTVIGGMIIALYMPIFNVFDLIK